jgi:MYND finger
VLLYTLLIDDASSDSPRNLWDLFFNLYVDSMTLELIRQQSGKLASLSTSIRAWSEGPYGNNLRMANTETIQLLHHFWTLYHDPTTSFSGAFRKSVKAIYENSHQGVESQGFCKSSGPQAMSIQLRYPEGDWYKYSRKFWRTGSDNPSKNNSHCNPLFAYSKAGGSRFAVRKDTDPLLGFHLVTSLSKLTRDSPYRCIVADDNGQLNAAVKASILQFETWCASFRRSFLRGNSILRFLVGDAVSFCAALGLRNGHIYSRPGSAGPLQLDGQDYLDKRAPLTFNVVDTSFLVDSVGFHNLVPFVIPLFASNATVLYTSTIILGGNNEEHIVESMLCTLDVGTMSALFGILPTTYVSGLTTRAYHQDNASLPDPATAMDDVSTQLVITRLTWRSVTYLDTSVAVAQMTPVCAPKSMAKFLCGVFVRMLANRIMDQRIPIYRAPCYTPASFAVLLRFLKQRVHVKWEELWPAFLRELDSQPGAILMWQELLMYCHLFGVQESYGIYAINEAQLCPIRQNGVLSRPVLPDAIALVITIPRRRLQPIYNKALRDVEHLCIRFWLHLSWEHNAMFKHTFMNVYPVFGKLSATDTEATIDPDIEGWHGSSDLHLCAYMPTSLFFTRDPKHSVLSVRLSKETSTVEAFMFELGPDLEFFNTSLASNNVKVFSSLPGLKEPLTSYPATEYSTTESGSIAVRAPNKFSMSYPLFDTGVGTFTTKITVADENHQVLKDGTPIDVSHSSLCTVTVTYSTFQHMCNFPFPIDGKTVRLRVSRTNGWMEIIAQLASPAPPLPFPTISTWNLPYINFGQLPQLDTSDQELRFWLQFHLLSMFTDRELAVRQKKTDFMTNIKNSIHCMLIPTSQIVRLQPSDGPELPLLFLLHGLYLELNSHSVVRDAHVLPVTSEFEPINELPIIQITVNDAVIKFWKHSLPAMAERCRDWEHSEVCNGSGNCSCGQAASVLECPEQIKSNAVRIAVSPLFGAPYFQPTRGGFEGILKRLVNRNAQQVALYYRSMEPITDNQQSAATCKVCGNAGTKKSGRCSQVMYCSKECQVGDWREHKSVCNSSAR